MTIQAIVHQAEEGGFWAEVPALPGCMTEGESMEEWKTNLREAIQGWTETATELALKQMDSNSTVLAIAA